MFQRYSAGTTFHTRKRTWYKFRSGFDTEWQKNDPAPTGAGFELVLPVSAQDSVLLYGYHMGMEPFFIVRWGTVGVQGKIKTLGTLKFPGLNGGEAGV